MRIEGADIGSEIWGMHQLKGSRNGVSNPQGRHRGPQLSEQGLHGSEGTAPCFCSESRWAELTSNHWSLPMVPAEPETRKHTVENAVRLGVAALVLAALVALGADHWRSHRAECTEFVGRGDLPGSDWGARQRGPGPGPGGHR